MSIFVVPEWMAELDEEDVAFIRRFLLASGSLKEVAGEYGVSYPTVRLRLDRLIQKIRLGEDDKVDFDAAKILISEYKKQKETNQT